LKLIWSVLSHARLPIPTLPHERELASGYQAKKLTNSMFSDFLDSRRQGLSKLTLLFYQRCLSKAIGVELTAEGINHFLSSLNCGNVRYLGL
jgi:hypothetical protein